MEDLIYTVTESIKVTVYDIPAIGIVIFYVVKNLIEKWREDVRK